MKSLSKLVVCLCGLYSLHVFSDVESAVSEQPVTAVIAISVGNFASQEGNLFVSVYADKESWLSENKVIKQRFVIAESISDGVIKTTIELPLGEYAFTVFHDENDNDKLDANFIGIPKEPGIISNNAKGSFGPPKYKDAKFELTAEGIQQNLQFK